jgi:hypothetical protein
VVHVFYDRATDNDFIVCKQINGVVAKDGYNTSFVQLDAANKVSMGSGNVKYIIEQNGVF